MALLALLSFHMQMRAIISLQDITQEAREAQARDEEAEQLSLNLEESELYTQYDQEGTVCKGQILGHFTL